MAPSLRNTLGVVRSFRVYALRKVWLTRSGSLLAVKSNAR